uniref:Uncharacterized protein MANES_12G149500 n=1 Tax=Rhizophora mucronata TaxID=61149 RepID=A0A2P2LBK2_RHIMU
MLSSQGTKLVVLRGGTGDIWLERSHNLYILIKGSCEDEETSRVQCLLSILFSKEKKTFFSNMHWY